MSEHILLDQQLSYIPNLRAVPVVIISFAYRLETALREFSRWSCEFNIKKFAKYELKYLLQITTIALKPVFNLFTNAQKYQEFSISLRLNCFLMQDENSRVAPFPGVEGRSSGPLSGV